MFQSRCGICCDDCERKAEVNCTGCLNMSVPFWGGDCGVKSCCESKELDHCGKCPEFPCEMLATMGMDMGYDPKPKIDQCKIWAKE